MSSAAVNQEIEDRIEYKPSFMGKVARVFIPALQVVLPGPVYRWVYDFLYESYKRLLRFNYRVRALVGSITADSSTQTKRRFTSRLLPFSMGGWKALENAFEVTAQAERESIPGALVECGVAEGGTAAMLAVTNRELGQSARQKWYFDSFEGLPEPAVEDYEDGKTGHFIRPLPKGACLGTIEQVSELLFDKLGFDRADVHLVKGWFQDTVPATRDQIGPIAVLRLDGDWYESTKIPLVNFYDQVSPGGFIIIDDYATCFGSRKAVDEFRQERQLSGPLHEDGRGGVWFQKPKG